MGFWFHVLLCTKVHHHQSKMGSGWIINNSWINQQSGKCHLTYLIQLWKWICEHFQKVIFSGLVCRLNQNPLTFLICFSTEGSYCSQFQNIMLSVMFACQCGWASGSQKYQGAWKFALIWPRPQQLALTGFRQKTHLLYRTNFSSVFDTAGAFPIKVDTQELMSLTPVARFQQNFHTIYISKCIPKTWNLPKELEELELLFLSLSVWNKVTMVHIHFWCTDIIHSIILLFLSQSSWDILDMF